MITAAAAQSFEGTYTLYVRIHLYCMIAAIFFLLLSVTLFFVLRIPRIFGELTGQTARRAVREMMESASRSGRLTLPKREREAPAPAHRAEQSVHHLSTMALERPREDFVVLRSIVEIHTDEVI